MKNSVLLSLLFLGLATLVKGQIPARSFDIGVDGFYNISPLTISRGGGSISGETKDFQLNGQLGYFFVENLSAGLRFRNAYEYFSVQGQFFNSTTGAYEPLIQISYTNVFGLYGRYYLDFTNYFAAFAHVEVGTGNNLISVTEENDQGEIEQVEYPRNIEDFGLGVGLAIRPSERAALELMVLRRTVFESYYPGGVISGPLQIETYLGYELRLGLRINLNFSEIINNRKSVPPSFRIN